MTDTKKQIEDEQYEGGTQGQALLGNVQVDEDPTKCCFCIPIEIGVIIIGIGIVFSAVSGVLTGVNYLSFDLIRAVV